MSKKSAHASRRKTPWDKESERTPMQEFLYQNYVNHYQERHPPLNETGEVELINTFRPESCPFCKTLNFREVLEALNLHLSSVNQSGLQIRPREMNI